MNAQLPFGFFIICYFGKITIMFFKKTLLFHLLGSLKTESQRYEYSSCESTEKLFSFKPMNMKSGATKFTTVEVESCKLYRGILSRQEWEVRQLWLLNLFAKSERCWRSAHCELALKGVRAKAGTVSFIPGVS